MVIQLLATLLGGLALIIGAATESSAIGLIVPSLALFILMDLLGLLTGKLKMGPGAFLPVAPAMFVHPWYVGLLIGFVAIHSIEVLIILVFGAILQRGHR